MRKRVFIYGSGGHARVIADILASEGKTLLGFIDDDPSKWRKSGPGPEIIGYEAFSGPGTEADVRVIIGIGDNGARRRVAAKMEAAGRPRFDTAVHPSAVIGGNTSLGPGTVVMAGAVINCGSAIGRQAIINTAASIDHDCRIEEVVHISPGARLGGGVSVGADPDWVLRSMRIALGTPYDWAPMAGHVVCDVARTVVKIVLGYTHRLEKM